MFFKYSSEKFGRKARKQRHFIITFSVAFQPHPHIPIPVRCIARPFRF